MAIMELKVVEGNFRPSPEAPNLTLAELKRENSILREQAVNIMLERRALICIEQTTTWLDTGTIEATLETNRYFLERIQAGKLAGTQGSEPQIIQRPNVKVNLPVYIHETAEITDSEIGPYASIGANCKIAGSRIEDSIIEADCDIRDIALKGSMVGRQAKVQGRGGKEVLSVNIGDDSSVDTG